MEDFTSNEPKKREPRFNATRHSITGQVVIRTPEEQIAYDTLSTGIIQGLGAQGPLEISFGQAIADDRWRLDLCSSLATSILALGVLKLDDINDHPEIDIALKQARTWIREGGSLALLSLYEQRIQRKIEKNMKMLRDVQKIRIEAFEKAVAEAEILMQYAASKGESFDIDRDMPAVALPNNFVFSSAEINRRAAHNLHLAAAKKALAPPKKPIHRVA